MNTLEEWLEISKEIDNLLATETDDKKLVQAILNLICTKMNWSVNFKTETFEKFVKETVEKTHFESTVVLPIILENEIHGVLEFFSTNRIEISQNCLNILKGIVIKIGQILQRQKFRLKLIQSAKMSALGEMTADITHEINNPLSFLDGKTKQILKKIESDNLDLQKIKEDLEKINKHIERISKIVKSLRSFSRNSELDPMSDVKISDIINDCLELCSQRFKKTDIALCLSGDMEYTIKCRNSQISQVLLNLLNNSCDAIENLSKKWIQLEVQALTFKKPDLNNSDNFVQISITDSGNGIPKNLIDNIMQPFFTTKEMGKGTGLGLSISKNIISEHNGSLKYDPSCPNTRFVIELPLSEFYS